MRSVDLPTNDDPGAIQGHQRHPRPFAAAGRGVSSSGCLGESRFRQLDAVAQPLHFWVNDIGMVFFFALAAKEVFEATLPGGSLAFPRRALSPLAAAVGSMVAPALICIVDRHLLGRWHFGARHLTS
jgi:hypothetical protein